MLYLLYGLTVVSAAPEAYLVQPLSRENMNYLTISPPCGGIPKGRAHLLSEPGSLNPVTWRIVTPSSGRCTVKISYGNDLTSYQTLIPSDNSTDSMGWFPCGEEEGLETKDFYIPDNRTCESCTLQWTWENKVATYYQCSDIEITESKDAKCIGKCKNGGLCSDGFCLCQGEWGGHYCEIDLHSEPVNILALFLVLMVLSIIAGALYYFLKIRDDKYRYETERLFIHRYCWCFENQQP